MFVFVEGEKLENPEKNPWSRDKNNNNKLSLHIMASIPVACIHFNLQDLRNEDVSD